MNKAHLIRNLLPLLILDLISGSSPGIITPIQNEWAGNHISATPMNGLETSTYSFCLHI